MNILDEIIQTKEQGRRHLSGCECPQCKLKKHLRGCQCQKCRIKQEQEADEVSLKSFWDWLFPVHPPKPSLPASKKIRKAVAYNLVKKKSLGWNKHFNAISKLIGFSGLKANQAGFAKAVADWQAAKGLISDGKLGRSTWKVMKPLLSVVSSSSSPSVSAPYKRIFPLPVLKDGRKPKITSKHWRENSSRAPRPAGHPDGRYGGHQGLDIMYPYKPGVDPPKSELKKKRRIDRRGKYWSPEYVWVTAFGPGKVISKPRFSKKLGWKVHIRHPDGLQSTYQHLSKPIVKKDDFVKAGERIAQLSSRVSLVHLHFEIRKKGRYRYRQSVNPRPYLKGIPFP